MELKPPMSYEEQLNKLIEHGIVVDDRDKAIDILKRVNYYRIMSNYCCTKYSTHSSL